MKTNSPSYYQEVGDYYDKDALEFESRYWKNPVLQQIRLDFRFFVIKEEFSKVLEIGIGSGLDLAHFSKIYQDVDFDGIDVSQEMVNVAQHKITKGQLDNMTVKKGTVEDVESLFPNKKYDLIYVFFGALNTVEHLDEVATKLNDLLTKEGKMVLTFVNKWYLMGILIELLKLNWGTAFSRIKKIWGGYSPSRHLASTCYSPKNIKKIFSDFTIVERKGYSIVHPAWYYHRISEKIGKKGRLVLWKIDEFLNKTIAWKWGEYTLFVFRKKS